MVTDDGVLHVTTPHEVDRLNVRELVEGLVTSTFTVWLVPAVAPAAPPIATSGFPGGGDVIVTLLDAEPDVPVDSWYQALMDTDPVPALDPLTVIETS
jgi:hypothetical protein